MLPPTEVPLDTPGSKPWFEAPGSTWKTAEEKPPGHHLTKLDDLLGG